MRWVWLLLAVSSCGDGFIAPCSAEAAALTSAVGAVVTARQTCYGSSASLAAFNACVAPAEAALSGAAGAMTACVR